jgi:hypothetical protein
MSAEPVDKLLAASGDLGRVASELEHLNHAFPRRVNTDPERVEKGLRSASSPSSSSCAS